MKFINKTLLAVIVIICLLLPSCHTKAQPEKTYAVKLKNGLTDTIYASHVRWSPWEIAFFDSAGYSGYFITDSVLYFKAIK